MKRTLSSILALVMVMAMALSMTVFASAAEGVWLDGSAFTTGDAPGAFTITPDAEGHGFTITLSSGLAPSGYAGALLFNTQGYKYMVIDVDQVNCSAWALATISPTGTWTTDPVRETLDISASEEFADVLWLSGVTDGTMSIHVKELYLVNDPDARPDDNRDTGVESAVAVAAAAVIGAGALIALSRKK